MEDVFVRRYMNRYVCIFSYFRSFSFVFLCLTYDSGTEEEDKQPISPTSITVWLSQSHMLNIKTQKKNV
jgi:hypothetical protein